MSPHNPTPARIEAAQLLKRLNDRDHLPTDGDVLELAALDPNDYAPRRRAPRRGALSLDPVLNAAVMVLSTCHAADGGTLTLDEVLRAYDQVYPGADQGELFTPRRATQAQNA